MPLAKLPLGGLGLAVLGVAACVWVAYPRPPDANVRDAYAALEGSPVPVEVIGSIEAVDARVQLVAGGYVLHENAAGLGEVTIAGNTDPSQLPPDAVTWQGAGASYAVQAAASEGQVRARVVSLEVARQQLSGSPVDTPLLYLFYLPALALFSAWMVFRLLWRS
jgi:hypothetical protein